MSEPRHWICALAALSLSALSTAASAQSSVPAAPPRHDVVCGWRNEEDCLKQLGALVARKDDQLLLKLSNGTIKTFATTTQLCEDNDWDKCRRYHIAGYYPRYRQFLVSAGFLTYGVYYLLVSERTGKEIVIADPPHHSPSGKRMATVSAGEMGDDYNGIQVWTMAGDLPKLEWRYDVPEGKYALYEFVAWDGDDRLKMRVTIRIDAEVHERLPVEAVRTKEGWKLMPPVRESAN